MFPPITVFSSISRDLCEWLGGRQGSEASRIGRLVGGVSQGLDRIALG